MDRATSAAPVIERLSSFESMASLVLPSRDSAFQTCREVIATDAGVLVLTGDPGMGKTWLRQAIQSTSAPLTRWVSIEILPGETADRLDRKIAHSLGFDHPDRLNWVDFLTDRNRNGERWTLALEESHNLTPILIEEVRILSENCGFSSLLMLGQTSLARRLALPAYQAFASRLTDLAHLVPIDADEAEILLEQSFDDQEWSMEEIEALHRDAAGVPGVLLRLARQRIAVRARTRPETPVRIEDVNRRLMDPPISKPARPAAVPATLVPSTTPLLGPDRPPLRVEEGLIEVGWNPDSDDLEFEESGEHDEPGELSRFEPAPVTHNPEHVAALQAWGSWAKDQGRHPTTDSDDSWRSSSSLDAERSLSSDESADSSPLESHPDVWAEPGQEFAPFGTIFPRNRANDERGA